MTNHQNKNSNLCLACGYGAICSGCEWIFMTPELQKISKQDDLRHALGAAGVTANQLPEIRWVSVSAGATRDRVDWIFKRDENGIARIGMYDRSRNSIVDLQGCPQLSPALETWAQEFRQFDFPIRLGSVRLRVSPQGRRGAWLDFANVDVKTLLDEGTLLKRLMKVATVEIGQRRKRLIERDGELKLVDPILENWFETYVADTSSQDANQLRPIPLKCSIGSFTQPGFNVNRALVTEVMNCLSSIKPKRAIEFGSGCGNFTLPLATMCDSVDAYENDRLALSGLSESLQFLGLKNRVKIHAGDAHRAQKNSPAIDFSLADVTLVDPPRSGLKDFITPFTSGIHSRYFIYVSCFAESFAQDVQRLLQSGYTCERLCIVDQFPQTQHYETVALLRSRLTPA